jgi:Zn finger protein HypA/HybF involved in hydrogenase expression
MDLEKLLKLLGVEKLDESKQNEIKEKLDEVVKIKAKEKSDELLKEEKDKIIEDYEEKFEDYKKDVTSKFSNFVDSILEEELVIPDKVMEFARKGELYSELIEQFKIRLAIDEGLLDGEVKSLLKEAREEITRMREKMDDMTADKLELETDAQQMAAALYLRDKCEGLTESQKSHVIDILGDVTDKEEINRKFDLVVETATNDNDNNDDLNEEEKDYKCPECGKKMTTEDEKPKCPECEVDMKMVTESSVETDENEEEELDEDDSPFKKHMSQYLKVLKENRW